MKKSPILEAIDQICEEKHIAKESVLATIEAALAVAYRKDFADKKSQNIVAEFNPEDASSRIFDVKEIVENELFEEYEKLREEQEKASAEQEAASVGAEHVQPQTQTPAPAEEPSAEESEEEKKRRFDPKSMIPLDEAKKDNPDANVGDIVKTELFPPEEYGRMAAQTAKQVIIQRLREAEREMTFGEFKEKVGEILTGTIQRIENRAVLVDLGHATAIMPAGEQIERENYQPGQRLKVYIVSVNQTTRGPEILVSRSHPDMVRKLFTQEVPEVTSGAITIKGIAREAGSRTKIAVYTTEPNIDPVGSCVGQRGTRVQTIIAELGGEKIDIIQYEDDPVRFIISALSPAKVLSVQLLKEEKRAIAEVKEDQLSFAIGRAGQNVRLAARLTGWKIDIVKESEEAGTKKAEDSETSAEPSAESAETIEPAETAEPASESEQSAERSEQAAESIDGQETLSPSPSQGGEARVEGTENTEEGTKNTPPRDPSNSSGSPRTELRGEEGDATAARSPLKRDPARGGDGVPPSSDEKSGGGRGGIMDKAQEQSNTEQSVAAERPATEVPADVPVEPTKQSDEPAADVPAETEEALQPK